jgi:hypothetical protein
MIVYDTARNRIDSDARRPPRKASSEISYDYDREQALVGSKFPLFITVTSPNWKKLNELKLILDDDTRNVISIEPAGKSLLFGERDFEKEFRYTVTVTSYAQPKSYLVGISYDHDRKYAGLSLDVGVKKDGRLTIAGTAAPVVMTAGESSTILLKVHNEFPDYTVNIRKLEVSSSPAGVVELTAERQEVASIAHDVTTIFPIELKAAPTTLKQLISDIRRPPTLNFTFDYDDDHGRVKSDFNQQLELRVKPDYGKILWAVLLGGVVGIMMRFGWQHLRAKL